MLQNTSYLVILSACLVYGDGSLWTVPE